LVGVDLANATYEELQAHYGSDDKIWVHSEAPDLEKTPEEQVVSDEARAELIRRVLERRSTTQKAS